MSTSLTRIRVLWTAHIQKKHKNWSSGTLVWNHNNDRVTLFDDDETQLSEGFMKGGPKLTKEFQLGSHLIQKDSDFEIGVQLSSSPTSVPISEPPLKRIATNSSKLLLNALNPSTSITPEVETMNHVSSNSKKLVTQMQPHKALPFRPPAKIEPKEHTSSTPPNSHSTESSQKSQESSPKRTSAHSRGEFRAPQKVYPKSGESEKDDEGDEKLTKIDESVAMEAIIAANPASSIPVVETPARRTFATKSNVVIINSLNKPHPPLLPPASPEIQTRLSRIPKHNMTDKKPSIHSHLGTQSVLSAAHVKESTNNAQRPITEPVSKVNSKFKSTAPAAQKRASFIVPQAYNPFEIFLGWTHTHLCFPSKSTIQSLPKITRRCIDIPVQFQTLKDYQTIMTTAIFEDINHALLACSTKYHEQYMKAVGGSATSKDAAGSIARLRQLFPQLYTSCELLSISSDPKHKYPKQAFEGSSSYAAPSPTNATCYLKIGQECSNQEQSGAFQKDDLWIISSVATFEPSSPNDVFFIARSRYHGKPSTVLELIPVSVDASSNPLPIKLPKADITANVFAIHGPSISSDCAMLENLYRITQQTMPTLPKLLGTQSPQQNTPNSIVSPTTPFLISHKLPMKSISDTLEDYLTRFHLNADQSQVFYQAASWFGLSPPVSNTSPPSAGVTLIHGVFGSGKSHMLVVLIMFICDLLKQCGDEDNSAINDNADTLEDPCLPQNIRILVSASTNTAVDRILVGLLEQDFTNFVRVGSLKKIDSHVLPYSIHREHASSRSHGTYSGENSEKSKEISDRAALRDLDQMLRQRGLTSVERSLIEQQKAEIASGSFEKKMKLVNDARVVGTTCISASFPILDKRTFQIVILDECSQMPEPLSLLPASRYNSRELILVGDPLQLPPQLRSRPPNEQSENFGLGKPLFSRLEQLGHSPILLRTQYRLHPDLSSTVNSLFYSNRLLDGISSSDRSPLHPSIPTCMFIDSQDGAERISSGGSVENPYEASLVWKLLHQFVITFQIPGKQIGVICPYKAQETYLNDLVAKQLPLNPDFSDEISMVQISTVDAFQGGEKDIIILSSCRTDWRGFIDSPFRMNVSLTRSRRHLIVIGSMPTLQGSDRWNFVIQKCHQLGKQNIVPSYAILSDSYFCV